MKITQKEYSEMTKKASPNSKSSVNYIKAFLVGGVICSIGQALVLFFQKIIKLELLDARTATSVVLIALAAILTAFGIFGKIAKHAGAGTLVPITGFANSMVSPAMEFKSEGHVLGIGAKMFTIAGPVLVFGISASFLYGLIIWIFRIFA
jgi:stage V sporulation protein AC